MPFKSNKQRRYLWANEPRIAREWTDRYGAADGGIMRVPFNLGSLPYPNYFKLPPASTGTSYTNTWTFPTDETTPPGSNITPPSSGTTSPGINPVGYGDRGSGPGGDDNIPGVPGFGNENYLEKTWQSKPGEKKEQTGVMKLLFPGLEQGTLGDRVADAPHIGLLGAIGWETSALNPDSKHYNSNLRGELNFLEGMTGTALSGNWKHATKFKDGKPIEFGTIKDQMMIGRDPRSGFLKYGPGSVLAGKFVRTSGDAAQGYEKALKEYIEKHEKWAMGTHFQIAKLKRAKEELKEFERLHKKPIQDAIIADGKGTDPRGRMTDTEYETFMDDDKMLGDLPVYDPNKEQGTPGYIRSRGANIDAGHWVGKKQHGHGLITLEDIKKDVTGRYTDDPSGLSGMDDAPDQGEQSSDSGFSDPEPSYDDNWGSGSEMIAQGGRVGLNYGGLAPRGSYFNGGLASLWRR